ncbi:hypothetical protein [Noviherbaspirillum aerium]|uniref:hypothetical protein n=1 Tax=Noviherbaspirillum aerium TaxID=2588497 RepID=UPI00124C8672|nr:hypothetical protein [Noviherbaspirillum aerium]
MANNELNMPPESGLTVPGLYPAVLCLVTQYTNAHGPRFRFLFSLPHGYLLAKTTSVVRTPKSELSAVLEGLVGRKLLPCEFAQFSDIAALEGTCCEVLVAEAQNRSGFKFSSIDRVVPLRIH